MKSKNYYCIVLCLLLLVGTTRLSAQNNDRLCHSFAIHVGYGNMLQGTGALTRSSSDYTDKLLQGVSWDAQYYYRPTNVFAVGAIYSGFSSKGSHEEGSDHLYTHYLAPQIGFYVVSNKYFSLRFNLGVGGMFYRNNSEVFEKERRVTSSSVAGNAGINAAYRISSHWAIEADIQYVLSQFSKVNSHYHNEDIIVRFPDEMSASRLNLSAGLSYSF